MNQISHTEAADSCCKPQSMQPADEISQSQANTLKQDTQTIPLTPEESFLASMLAGRDISDLTDPVHEQQVYDAAFALLTEKQQQHIAETDALKTVFYDIRERSHEGELTTCDYWGAVDLVPSHMTNEAFTDLVLNTLKTVHAESAKSCESDQKDTVEKQNGVHCLKNKEQMNASMFPHVPGHSTTQHPSAYQTTVVKTAKDFMEEAKRKALLKDQPEASQASDNTHINITSKNISPEKQALNMQEPPQIVKEKVLDAKSTSAIKVQNVSNKVVDAVCNEEPKEVAKSDTPSTKTDPINTAEDDSITENESIDPEVQKKLDELLTEPTWDVMDIQVLEGSEPYIYSQQGMTDSFAHWAFLAAEDNDVTTFVDTVRTESSLYPRPMIMDSLHNKPFFMDDNRIWSAFHTTQSTDQYADIQQCSASNGDVYFYSTLYLSPAQAKALAEWFSVERKANM